MPRQLVVTDDIRFRGSAAHRANVNGPMLETMVHFKDHFFGDTLSTDNWAAAVPGTADSIAINEQTGGACRLTTGSSNGDSCMLSGALIWKASKKAVLEARITITDVSGCGVFVGFTDAKSEVNTSMAIHYPSDALTTAATNAVGFVIDGDHSTSSIMLAGVKADSDETAVDSGTDWGDGETKTLRVETGTGDNGDEAIFWLDGEVVAYLDDAVTTSTLLCASVQAITRGGGGSTTVDVHRVDVWQDE